MPDEHNTDNSVGGNLPSNQDHSNPNPTADGGNAPNANSGNPTQQPGGQGKPADHPWNSSPWQDEKYLQQYQPQPYNYQGQIASQFGAGLYGGLGGYGSFGGLAGGGVYPGGALGGYPGTGAGLGSNNSGLAGAYAPYAPTFSSLPISPIENIQGKYEELKVKKDFATDSAINAGIGGGIIGSLAGIGMKVAGKSGVASLAVAGITAATGLLGGYGFGSWFGEREAVLRDTNDDGRLNGSTGVADKYKYAQSYNPNNVNLAY